MRDYSMFTGFTIFTNFEAFAKSSSFTGVYKILSFHDSTIFKISFVSQVSGKQARKSSEDTQAGYAQFEKVWAG